ncbi:MAG: single-stranded-DNA-specific exonuclease RecJ [Patescibacteria group bacterium]
MSKRWEILDPCPAHFTEELSSYHPVVPHLLWHRGIQTIEDVESFLKPSFASHVHDPFLFSNMHTAVKRVFTALRGGERILIFGDYDADGLTGSACLIQTIRDIHSRMSDVPALDLHTYIPHRDKEGYGLQMPQAERFAEEGTNLLITVDCGIACVNEIAHLRAAHVDVIVVDHHQFGETLPDAILIHPSVPGETYPFKFLAAVGVAWKVSCALTMHARECGIDMPAGYEKWLLDFVAIATVTDIVPLVGENRALETFGLIVLNKTRRPGLRALIRSSGLAAAQMNARDIGFAIGPRLNAPGRMDHAAIGLELLLEESQERADAIAKTIEGLNRDRQDMTKLMMAEADILLETFSSDERVHVLWRDDWSPSLVGLVAGRVSDRYGMPVIAIGKHQGQWIGSGRSYSYYNIAEAVQRAGEGLLTRSGGHAQACGFALAEDDHVPAFAQRLRDDARGHINEDRIGSCMEIHADIRLRDITNQLVDALESLEPYGAGNPKPLFIARNIEVLSSTTVGRDATHLRIVGRDAGGVSRTFIAFGMGKRKDEATNGCRLDIVFTISRSEWNGVKDIQCKVEDFRKAEI